MRARSQLARRFLIELHELNVNCDIAQWHAAECAQLQALGAVGSERQIRTHAQRHVVRRKKILPRAREKCHPLRRVHMGKLGKGWGGLFVVAGVALVCLAADAAQAATGKMVSNAVYACRIGAQDGFRYDWLGLYNTSTTEAKFVDCGVQKHSMTGGTLHEASVTVTDMNPNDDVVCNMQGLTQTGATWFTGETRTTAGITGTTTFFWRTTDVPGWPYISCMVPAAGSATKQSKRSGVNAVSATNYTP